MTLAHKPVHLTLGPLDWLVAISRGQLGQERQARPNGLSWLCSLEGEPKSVLTDHP